MPVAPIGRGVPGSAVMEVCMTMELIALHVDHEGDRWPLWRQGQEGDPLIRDLDWAVRLGYPRPYEIRKLIKGMTEDEKLGVVFASQAKTSRKGGRPTREYYLTEEQAWLVATQAQTDRAWQVTRAMVRVFMLARQGSLPHGAANCPPPAPEPAPAIDPAALRTLIAKTVHQEVRAELRRLPGELGAVVLALVKPVVVSILQDPEVRDARRGERFLTNQEVAAELGLSEVAWRKFVQRNESLQVLARGPGRAKWVLAEVRGWMAKYRHDRRARRAANDAARAQRATLQ